MAEKFDIFAIRSNNVAPKPGRILISEPFLPDFYFNRAVILLVEHNDEGSLGVVMNKPSTRYVSDAVEGFPESKAILYLGGPVSTENLFFIHARPDLFEESYPINENLFWGADIPELKELISLKMIQPEEFRIFAGYSGWSKGQLQHELKVNSWVVGEMEPEVLMQAQANELWEQSVRKLGKDYRFWLNLPANPELN